jgi:hypothetical protein
MILGVFWTVSYSLSVHQRRQAELLLRQVAALQPGGTGSPAVQQVAKDFGGRRHCSGELCSYDFENSFAFTDSPTGVLRRTEWDYFGLRPWQVTAHIETRSGELSGVYFRAVIGRGRGWLYDKGLFSGSMWAWLMVSVRTDAEQFEQDVKLEKEYVSVQALKTGHQITAGNNGLIVGKPHWDTPGSGQVLTVNLSPGTSPASRSVAFDLNLRCATALSLCTELCQLTPAAWRSYSEYQKSNGWWVEEATECTPASHR